MLVKITLDTISSMTLSRKFFAITLLTIFPFILNAQELNDSEELFYCSQSFSINQIWPISDSYFLANIKYNEGKFFRSDLLFLLNKNHLVTDSLLITSGFINNISIYANNRFSIATSMNTSDYSIKGDKIVRDELKPNKNGGSIFSGDMSDIVLANYQGYTFGYETKAKDRTKKRSKRNVPKFYYQDENSKEKNWINSGSEPIKGDQWKSFQSRDLFALAEVINWEGKIYFSIPMIGKCYIFDLKTKIVDQILYPEDGAESWYFTIDRATGKKYLIGDMGNDLFDIYYVQLESNNIKKQFLKQAQGFFDTIFQDKIILKRNLTFDNTQQACYLLQNLYEY
jgi:hypothetical protein